MKVEDIYPLSPLQQGLLFHTEYAPGSGVYFEQFHMTLTGQMEVRELRDAWGRAMQRHPILRTAFDLEVAEEPLQIVYSEVEVPFKEEDWRGYSQSEQDRQLQAWLRADIERGFEVGNPPLFRVTLLRTGDAVQILVLSMHHVLLDGWSLARLLPEVFGDYFSRVRGQAMAIPSARPYRDYIAWLQRQDQGKAEQYWKQALSGFEEPTLLEIGGVAARVGIDTHHSHYSKHRRALSVPLNEALKEFGKREQLTVNTVMQGAWAILLARYTGQNDICFGNTMATRPTELLGSERIQGLLINTLPLRVQIRSERSCREWLHQLQRDAVELRQYDYFPLHKLQGYADVSAGQGLFNTLYAFENYPIEVVPTAANAANDPGALKVSNWNAREQSNFPLLIAALPGDTLAICLMFNERCFELAAVERLADHYVNVLEQLVARSELSIGQLELLTAPEHHQLLVEWNQTQVNYLQDKCVHRLFEEQAARTPEAIAAVYEDRQISYEELNRASNRVAHWLIEKGVGPDVLVGLCIERSLEMLVGILGILKAGGAYLPIDPSYPEERVRYLLGDAGVQWVLTQNSVQLKLAALESKVTWHAIDTEDFTRFSDQNPQRLVFPGNLAYCIYTSGSTGNPKGVLISHHCITRLFAATQEQFNFSAQDSWTMFHSYAFDFSVWEIWGPLLHGGRVVIVSYLVSRDPELFYDLLLQKQVTILNQTPSAFAHLVRLSDGSKPKLPLRLVIFGGEALHVSELDQWLRQYGDASPQLINMYGITETTVHVTYRRIALSDINGSSASPIGRPLDDLQAYVLDNDLNLVPIGVAGELFVAGHGLARGYLNRAGLTAERFIANPFGQGERLYRTGDRVRYLADGNLEYLGRTDRQVKIRGFRIELGEIEAALLTDASIKQAVVVVREDEPKAKRLVGYIVPKAGVEALSPDMLRLPNEITISQINDYETRSIYNEIFVEKAYMKHGIALHDGCSVFDVGANIGLFTLFVCNRYPNARVFSFEPVPPIYEKLRKNVETLELNATAISAGLSDRQGTVDISHYPGLSANSGLYADVASEAEVTRKFLQNAAADGIGDASQLGALADEIIKGRFESETYKCELMTVSDAIRQTGVSRIDLLKIDVEKSEWDVLMGIETQDWLKIDQIVIEVHDIDGRVAKVNSLLDGHGFTCTIEAEKHLIGTGLYQIFATRHAQPVDAALEPVEEIVQARFIRRNKVSIEEVRQRLKALMPEYMIPSAIVVLESLPLTLNGKIDRRALPAPDMVGQLEKRQVEPRTELEKRLAEIWSQVLKVERVGIYDNFFELGGDSILAIMIVARANQLECHLTVRQIFEHQSIAAVAAAVGVSSLPQASSIEPESLHGKFPLTPIQMHFFEGDPVDKNHFNQALMLECSKRLSEKILEQAIQQLVVHHDALRLRFEVSGIERMQTYAQIEESQIFEVINFSEIDAVHRREAVRNRAQMLQESLDIASGPVFRSALFDFGPDSPQQLFIVAHHLAIDAVSWRILNDDLQVAYRQLEVGEPPNLPAKTSSYKKWSEHLTSLSRSESLFDELHVWTKVARADRNVLPADFPSHENTFGDLETITVSLSEDKTRSLLQGLAGTFGVQITDVLVTGLFEAFATWTGQRRLLIALERHGREEIFDRVSTTRTVGWFTSVFPLLLEDLDKTDDISSLKSIGAQIRQIPQSGIGYGVLRYIGKNRDLENVPQPEIAFNYLGQLDASDHPDALFSRSTFETGTVISSKVTRRHLVEVNAYVAGGKLHAHWSYSGKIHSEITVQRLADHFVQYLSELISRNGSRPQLRADVVVGNSLVERLRLVSSSVQLGDVSDIADFYPMSPLQQGLLFHGLYAPSSLAYITTSCFGFNGRLDPDSFQQAWQSAVDRHPILRTAFVALESSTPLQMVRRAASLTFERVDLSHLATPALTVRLQEVVSAQQEKPFDLTKPPLMRIALIRISDTEHQIIWTHHHVLFDGWSVPVLLSEVSAIYVALVRGISPSLPAVPENEYGEYIAWIERQDHIKAETYWRSKLACVNDLTSLAIETPASKLKSGEDSQRAHYHRSEMEMKTIEMFARQHRLTVNAITLGAWSLLLSRYSGTSEVLFGVTVSGRPADISQIERRVGLFVNTLPAKVNLANNQTIVSFLRDIQAQQHDLIEYQFSSLIDIQKWSGRTDGTPLFDNIYVFENFPMDALKTIQGPGMLQITNSNSMVRSHYQLSFQVVANKELDLTLWYDCSRIGLAEVTQMARHFDQLLRGMLANPLAKLGEISLLSASERSLILEEWNKTSTDYPRSSCYHELFNLAVERNPNAIAVEHGMRRLTYRELDESSNRVAHMLRSRTIQAEDIVGICIERSAEMVIALLGVLKAGAAYLPLDPGHPVERLAYLLEDTKAKFVLTHRKFQDRFADHEQKLVVLDADLSTFSGFPCTALESVNCSEHLAYVIYTSGSTGRPKGVMVSHSGLVNYLSFAVNEYRAAIGGSLVSTNFSFDATVTSLLVPLVVGSSITLLSEGPEELSELGQRLSEGHRYSLVKMTPAHLIALENLFPSAARNDAAQAFVIGGEQLSSEHVKFWKTQAPEIRLINEYGPTETVVGCATYEVQSNFDDRDSVPIGRPIANTCLYVLDDGLEPVPLGVWGELFIGGAGLARGYLNRAGLTAERFVANPFSITGDRLYRTGDRVRYLTDGNLEFRGRFDQQVKIRGFRIELGEIEAALLSAPRISQAIVLASEDQQDDRQLVAYVTLTRQVDSEGAEDLSNEPPSSQIKAETVQSLAARSNLAIEQGLKEHLRRSLPEYMVPANIVCLNRFPLTANGKVDRKALPVLQPSVGRVNRTPTALTSTELAVVEIWKQVLKVDDLDPEQNFFALGGHSLSAVQTISRIRAKFGVQLPLRIAFEKPTVREIAEYLELTFAVASAAAGAAQPEGEQFDEASV